MNRYRLPILLLSLLPLLDARSVAAAEKPVKFPLMAWDYADDRATLAAMAECGITSVAFVPPKALDLCRDAGIGAVVFDERISGRDWTKPFDGDAAVRNLPAVIKEVGDHPAVIGYHIRDEPGAGEFPELAKAVAAIKQLAPGKWPYINLLPGDGEPYDKYVEDFVTVVQADRRLVRPLRADRRADRLPAGLLGKPRAGPPRLAEARPAVLEHRAHRPALVATATSPRPTSACRSGARSPTA